MRVHPVPNAPLWVVPALTAWLAPHSVARASCSPPFECACSAQDLVVVGEVVGTSVRDDGWSEVEIEVTGKAIDGEGVIEDPEPEVVRALAGIDVSLGDLVIADADGDGGHRVRLVADADGRFSCQGADLSADDLLALAFAPDCVEQMEGRTGQSYVCDDHDSDTACFAAVGGRPNAPSVAVVLTGMTLLGLGVHRRARRRSGGPSPRSQAG